MGIYKLFLQGFFYFFSDFLNRKNLRLTERLSHAIYERKDYLKRVKMMKNLGRFLLPVAILALLAACSPRIDYRGKAPEIKSLSKIQTGVHTSHDVLATIGSPTFESTYGPKTWFYVHKKTETTSFLKPSIAEKNTIAITFNEQGVVEKIEDMDPEMQDIDPLTHTTPTVGADRTILQQVFSNFGRVARKSEKK